MRPEASVLSLRFRGIGKLCLFLLLVMLLLPGASVAQSATDGQAESTNGNSDADEVVVLDEIVAKVNNEIITLTDLDKALAQLRNATRQEYRDPQEAQRAFERRRRNLLQTLIQTKIMVQRAEELGLGADIDLDVSKYIEEMRKEAGFPSLEILDQYLKERGMSLAEYRRNVKEQMITRSLLGSFVYSKITLLTSEIQSYYEANKDRFAVPAKVHLAEILFLTEGKNRAEVRKRAEEALAKLEEGVPFEEVAREYSEGPTASRGGDIGEFQKGSMNEAIEAVVFEQPVGTHSDIIESDYGFQIVRVIERDPPSILPLEEVRTQIVEALYEKKAEPEVQEYIKDLLEESYVYVNPKYAEQYDLSGLGL